MSQNNPQGFSRMPQGQFFSQNFGEENLFQSNSTIEPNYEETAFSLSQSGYTDLYNQNKSGGARQQSYIQPMKNFDIGSEIFAMPPGITQSRNITEESIQTVNKTSFPGSANSSVINKPLNSNPIYQYTNPNQPGPESDSQSTSKTYSSANSFDNRRENSFIMEGPKNTSSNQHLQPQSRPQNISPTPNFQQMMRMNPFPKPQPSMFQGMAPEDYDEPVVRRVSDSNKNIPNPKLNQSTPSGFQKQSQMGNKSRSSDQIDEMILAISTSTHGASKFLHELCDQLKKQKPVTTYDSKLVEKQPVFIAWSKLEEFTGVGEGKSKQDAKNEASLQVLKQMAESDSFAESSLRLIISKDKSIKLMNRSQTLSTTTQDTSLRANQAWQQQPQSQQWPPVQKQMPQMQIQPQQPMQTMQQTQPFQQWPPQHILLQQQQQKGLMRTWPLEEDEKEQDFRNSDSIGQRSYDPADDFFYEPQGRNRSTSLRDQNKMPQSSQHTTMEETSPDFDSLAVLNELSHDNKITPKWNERPITDGFESEVIFDVLPKCVGTGKKKKDARREAATKLFQYIQKSPELRERYLHKYQKRKLSKGGTTNVTHVSAPETKVVDSSLDISSVNLSTIPIIEPKKGLFDQWISPSIFSELKTYLETMGGMNVFPS